MFFRLAGARHIREGKEKDGRGGRGGEGEEGRGGEGKGERTKGGEGGRAVSPPKLKNQTPPMNVHAR
jgi:hypothetical protein